MKKNIDLWVDSKATFKKTLMELKIAFLIIVVSVSNLAAVTTYSQSTKVSLDINNKSVEQVLDEIESQSEFYFIFNQKQIDINRVVNIQAEERLITDVLPELFSGTNVNYAVIDRKILLTTDPLDNIVLNSLEELQQNVITGRIVDETGSPMPGVNIQVQGTTIGAITNMDGRYSIAAENLNVVLVFSFIGYETQTVPARGRANVDISLVSAVSALQEVVVTGYGTQRKKDITGSVTVVNPSDLKQRVASNFAVQLQGQAAGVVIGTQGAPGSVPMVRIRGIGTVNNNAPLFVIDGVSTTNQDLSSLNPNDIESMQILKDASSASIYGAQASNGVIIITTKKGKTGATKVTYDASYSVSTPVPYYDILNSRDWANHWFKARVNAAAIRQTGAIPSHPQFGTGTTPVFHKYIIPTASDGSFTAADWTSTNRIAEFSEGTDWYNETTQNAGTQSHQLTFSGGNESTKYLVGLNYFDQEGTYINTYYTRYAARINTETKIRKWWRFGENLNMSISNQNRSESQSEGNLTTLPYLITPFIPVYDIAEIGRAHV